MNNFKVLMNGIVKENPTFVLLLGMCPTLGTTSSADRKSTRLNSSHPNPSRMPSSA